jgi:hypothetical protein
LGGGNGVRGVPDAFEDFGQQTRAFEVFEVGALVEFLNCTQATWLPVTWAMQ